LITNKNFGNSKKSCTFAISLYKQLLGMKSSILLALMLAGFAFGSLAQEQATKTGWDKNGLKCKVKSVKSIDYFAVTKTDGDKTIIEKGKTIEHGKNKKTEFVDTYDEDGNKTSEDNESSVDDSWMYSGVASTKTYKYNTDGSLQTDDWKSSSYFYTWRQTSNGSNLERNTYSDGKVYTEIISKYDANGNKIADKSSSQKVVYKYDENGNKIEKTISDRDGKVLFQHTYFYEYDQQSNWTSCIELLFAQPVKISERTIEYFN
jgi:YD repeat-containing protein